MNRLAYTALALAVNLAATAELLAVVELVGRPVIDVWFRVLARVAGPLLGVHAGWTAW